MLFAFRVAVPWAGVDVPVTVSGSLSGSLSLASTVTVTGVAGWVAAESLLATGARFEVMALENSLFGSSVTTAGLLPGGAFRSALEHRADLDLALLPAEAVNDDLLFMDDLHLEKLAAQVPMPVSLSYDFVDALALDDSPVHSSTRGEV